MNREKLYFYFNPNVVYCTLYKKINDMRILIVGQKDEGIETIKLCLYTENYTTDFVHEHHEGLYLAETYTYNLVILNNITTSDSIAFCSRIRENNLHTPIIVTEENRSANNITQILDCGADDCICYPLDCNEVLARIRAILRRPHKIESEILTVADLIVDTRKCLVRRNQQDIYLTKKEFSLLKHLIRNKEEVLSRHNIMENVWGSKISPFSNTLESHIRSLRKKIELEKSVKLIITVPGRGYKIREPY